MAPLTFLAALLLTAGVAAIVYWLVAAGHVISSDLAGSGRILLSRHYPLSGKPDVILKKRRTFTPVEYKSYSSGGNAREWDVAQLLSYCLLIEENGGRTAGGRLVYRDMEFFVPWDARSRQRIENTILEMLRGSDRKTGDMWKCRMCEFRERCGR